MYVFGDPANMSDPSKRLALRIHDEVGLLDGGDAILTSEWLR